MSLTIMFTWSDNTIRMHLLIKIRSNAQITSRIKYHFQPITNCIYFVHFCRVIVGAPRTDLSNIMQQNVLRGGAVYRCDIYDDNRCHLIPFDSAGKFIHANFISPLRKRNTSLTKDNHLKMLTNKGSTN